MSQRAPFKGMVLAAGEGRRLRPLTVFRAKPALPVLGGSSIECALSLLRRAGATEVVVNLHHNPETIETILAGSDPRQDLILHYSREAEILGTGGGLKQAEAWLSDGTFVVVNGDTIVDADIAAMLDWHRQRSAEATLMLRPRPEASAYTNIGLREDGRIVAVGKKSETSEPLMFAGLWVLEPTVFERLPAGRFSRLEVDLLPKLVHEGSVFGFVADCPWFDIGTPDRYLQACREMARRGIFRETWRAEAVTSLPSSPEGTVVLAGPGTVVDPTARFTGTSILGADCRVARGATIRGAVLWDGVTVGESAVVRDSVIGDGVSLAAGSRVVNKMVARLRKEHRRACASVRSREVAGDCVVAPIRA